MALMRAKARAMRVMSGRRRRAMKLVRLRARTSKGMMKRRRSSRRKRTTRRRRAKKLARVLGVWMRGRIGPRSQRRVRVRRRTRRQSARARNQRRVKARESRTRTLARDGESGSRTWMGFDAMLWVSRRLTGPG
jgi:hypothetical protein